MTTISNTLAGGRARTKSKVQAAPLQTEVAVLTDAMVVVSIVCGWLLLQLLVLGGLSYDRAQSIGYDQFRGELAAATAPVGGAIEVGAPVAIMSSNRLGDSQVVFEGTAPTQMLAGPGHRRDTVLPGQPGTAVLFGRASTYGAPFASLDSFLPGDKITTVTGQGKATFKVTDVRRAGDPQPQPLGQGEGRLTLVGAEGTGTLAGLSPSTVQYVDAELVSKSFEPGASRVSAVSVAEQPMGRDVGVLPLLSLALAGLAVLVAIAAVSRPRLGTARTWVILVAPVMALSWMATDLGMALLPNLL
ncbi:MAG TPA: sortase [Aeromicrobium sp.]|nr:sortase [Aeromicrobium sp.]